MWYPKCESLRKPSWVQIWSNVEVMSMEKTGLLSASILAFVPTITLHFAKKHMHKNQLILKDKGNTQNSSVTDALSMILSVDLYPCQKRNTAPCGTLRAWSIKGISPWKVLQESHKMVKRPSFPYGMAWLVTNVAWPLFALQWFVWCTPVYPKNRIGVFDPNLPPSSKPPRCNASCLSVMETLCRKSTNPNWSHTVNLEPSSNLRIFELEIDLEYQMIWYQQGSCNTLGLERWKVFSVFSKSPCSSHLFLAKLHSSPAG